MPSAVAYSGFRGRPGRGQRVLGKIFGRAPAAIDDDGLAVDEAAALGTQERDGAGDIFDFTEPRVRCHLDIDALEQRIFEPAGDHRRHRHARRDVVAADAERAVLAGDVRGQCIEAALGRGVRAAATTTDDGEGRGRSEEHTSELQSLMRISYAV